MDEKRGSDNSITINYKNDRKDTNDYCVLKTELTHLSIAKIVNTSRRSKKSTIFRIKESARILNKESNFPLTFNNFIKVRQHVNELYKESRLQSSGLEKKKNVIELLPVTKKKRYIIKKPDDECTDIICNSRREELMVSKKGEIADLERTFHTYKDETHAHLESILNTGTIRTNSVYCFFTEIIIEDHYFTKIKLNNNKHYCKFPENDSYLQEMDLREQILKAILVKLPLNDFPFVNYSKNAYKLKKSDALQDDERNVYNTKLSEHAAQDKTIKSKRPKLSILDTIRRSSLLNKIENINNVLRRKIKQKDCLIEHLMTRLKERKKEDSTITQLSSLSSFSKAL